MAGDRSGVEYTMVLLPTLTWQLLLVSIQDLPDLHAGLDDLRGLLQPKGAYTSP